jgi:hypothetical protein
MKKIVHCQAVWFVSVAMLALFFARPAKTFAIDLTNADELRAALHTATPVEDKFIDNVVAKVNDGTLPMDLVKSTYVWASRKPLERRFYYFKYALIQRAGQIGVSLQ